MPRRKCRRVAGSRHARYREIGDFLLSGSLAAAEVGENATEEVVVRHRAAHRPQGVQGLTKLERCQVGTIHGLRGRFTQSQRSLNRFTGYRDKQSLVFAEEHGFAKRRARDVAKGIEP